MSAFARVIHFEPPDGLLACGRQPSDRLLITRNPQEVGCTQCRQSATYWVATHQGPPPNLQHGPLPAAARATIDLAVRTLGDILRSADLSKGNETALVATLTDLRGLLAVS